MVRQSFEVMLGRSMEYELLLPQNYDPSVPRPWLISVSGVEQTHVNYFSRRLQLDDWVIAVPLRPQHAPLLFEGCGQEGDGIWHMSEFCRHLLGQYKVEGGSFLFVGVSNGGNAVVRFATLWPKLCRGIVAVTAALHGPPESLRRLQGIPIDMYVGTNDECGFYQPMLDLEENLRRAFQTPPALLTVFEGGGHCCSPLVDQHLVIGKLRLMLLRSCGAPGRSVSVAPPEPGVLTSEEILMRLRSFGKDLGLKVEPTIQGGLLAQLPVSPHLAEPLRRPLGMANVSMVRLHNDGGTGPSMALVSEPVAMAQQQPLQSPLPTLLGGHGGHGHGAAAKSPMAMSPSPRVSGGVGTPLCRSADSVARSRPRLPLAPPASVASASPRWPGALSSVGTPAGVARGSPFNFMQGLGGSSPFCGAGAGSGSGPSLLGAAGRSPTALRSPSCSSAGVGGRQHRGSSGGGSSMRSPSCSGSGVGFHLPPQMPPQLPMGMGGIGSFVPHNLASGYIPPWHSDLAELANLHRQLVSCRF